MQLSLRLVPVGETTLIVVLTGELDSTTRPVLAAFLDPLPHSHVKYVVVAAGDLWFCDLNGLEQLARTHQAMRAKGGHLAVAEPRSPLRRLVALMAAHTQPAIPLYTSMPEALAAAGVETYEMPATPASRHLPRLRAVRRAPSTGVRHRPRARQEPPRGSPDAVVVLDDELRVTVWGPGAEELWGLRADEALGGALASLDLGLPLEKLLPHLRAALAGEAQGTVLDAVDRRGWPMPLAVRLSRLRAEDDDGHGLTMVMNVLGPGPPPDR